MHHSNSVHRTSVKDRRDVGPSKSGGAVSFSPISTSSLLLDMMIFFELIIPSWRDEIKS